MLGGWVVLGGIGQQRIDAAARIFDAVTADAGLSVERVLVDGRVRTDRQSLIDALGVEVGAPILGVEIATARARVGALPWSREVTVERRLPDTLLVRIVERRPLAVWQNGGSVAVVDVDGQVIDGARPRDFPELLLVVGPDAPVMAADLLAVMARTPDLSTRVTAGAGTSSSTTASRSRCRRRTSPAHGPCWSISTAPNNCWRATSSPSTCACPTGWYCA